MDHRDMRVQEQAAVPADAGGVPQAFDRLEREAVMLAEVVDRAASRLQAVLRDAEPQKGDGSVGGSSSASALARGLDSVANRFELVRIALVRLIDRVDL